MEKFEIKDFTINKFRGLKNITLSDCKKVNLILGDNNVGKTSILEALLLSGAKTITEVLSISSYRSSWNGRLNCDNFKYLFPFGEKNISISLNSSSGKYDFEINYYVENVVFDKNIFLEGNKNTYGRNYFEHILDQRADGNLIKQYSGFLKINKYEEKFSFNSYDFLVGNLRYARRRNNQVKINYVSPYDHFRINALGLSGILKNSNYHELLIEILKIFDANIEDILIIQNEDSTGLFDKDIYIKSKNSNPKPLYLFGDGIKKVLNLSLSLINTREGILLLDEIETSLHHSYFYDIFTFLVRAAYKLDVQLFITTHSKETIDEFLSFNEKEEYASDSIALFTIRKRNDEFFTRRLSGKNAKSIIEDSSVEVRN